MRALLGLILAALVACAPSTDGGTPLPSEVAGATPGGATEDCEPLELRAPSGERVDLSGTWRASSGRLVEYTETAWLLQDGECISGSVMNDDFLSGDAGGSLANVGGRIGSDFAIPMTVAILDYPEGVAQMRALSQMTMLIEWDDAGRIRLREDREPGELAERCPPEFLDACPAPLVLLPIGEAP